MNALAVSLQTYFTTFAHTQRDLSVNTIASYRDTWRMLLKYLTATLKIPADALDFDVVTATHVTGFLDHLEHERGNSARTRNARLTAIRAVLGRALPDHPEYAATINIDLNAITEPILCAPNDPDDARLLSEVQGEKIDEARCLQPGTLAYPSTTSTC